MYHIFYGNNIIFDPYGNENEVVANASLNASINAASYLDFTMAITHPLYDVIAEKSGIVKLLWDDNVLFEGQIESIDIDMCGDKTISCVSALDYLNDTIVRPYSTISGEQTLTAPSSVDGYFQWLIDQHNSHVKDSSKLFYVGVNQGANLQYNNFIYRSSSNNPTTASEITNQILDSLGGYLTMRYENGLHVLDLYSDVHTMNAQIIDFGVNLKDFSKKIKTNDQYTALIAKGGSPKLLNGGFESGDFGYWETHPNTEITTAKAQEGSHSSYIVEGVATYIPTSFFYAKKNGRYKSTFYVKNERSSDVTIHAGYETNVLDSWSKASEQQSFVIKNDDQWHECVFEFTVNVEDNTKVRPYWYSDNISNAGGARVYFDGFAFTRTISGNPVSEDPIDISLLPDGGTRYDSNVIKSDDVIYNPDRVSRYGYREKVFTDSTITDLDDLIQAAIKELNKLAEPTVGLDIKAVDLALYMDGYTHLTVGDAVRVRSALHDTDEYLMVTSINLNLEDPGNSEYVIGQAYDSLTGQQSGYLRSLSSGINSSLDAVVTLDETTKDQAIKIGTVTEVANKAQETANTASSKADSAQSAANKAQSTADSNKNAIDATNAEIEAAKQGIANAEGEIVAVNGRIDTMNGQIEAINNDITGVNGRIDSMNGEIETVSGSVDSLRTEVSTEVQNVKASVDTISSKADSAMDKASVLAGNLEATDAIVHQHTDKIGELTTSVSNATTKADSALRAATTATQTANEFKTTATTAYKNAEEALTQSSTAVQKANEVSLNLSTNYQTKADADALYATQASLKATSDSITSTVEKTYATKSSVELLQNIADSAIETWVGSVVPTDSNKPASDWTTSALKRQHSGDIYYDTSTGYSYRYGSTDGATYSWTMIKDSDIQKAIQDAADAQLTANGAKDSVDQLALDIPNIYATKTELTQTSDSIKASVSEVTKTANSALNKATTVEQTANGISATVSEQATKLDKTVTTVNKISAKADSISTSLTQTTNKLNGFMFGQLSNKGFETGDLSGWEGVDSIGTLYIDQTYVNTGKYSLRLKGPMAANGYIVSTDMFTITGGHKYKVSCYANGWHAQYYLKIGLRIGTNSATYQYVTANLPSLASNLNFNKLEAVIEAPATLPNSTAKTYQGTICVGMARAWTAANNLYFDDFSIEDVTDLESANTNASEALAKASTIEQSVDSFKTSVTEKLNTTTSKLDSITSGKMNNLGFESGDTSGWEYNDSFGTLSIVSDWQVIAGKSSLKVNTPLSSGGYFKTTEWFYAIPGHTYKVSFILSPSSGNVVSFKLGAYLYKNGIGTYVTTTFTNVSSTTNRYEAIVEAPLKLNGSYPNYQGYIYLEWTKNNTSKSNYVVIDEFDVEDITDLNKASSDAAAAIEKASTLEQTVDGFKTTVSQTYETKEDALKKQSTLNQTIDGFKTNVSQTYETKQEALNKQSTLNQTLDGFKTNVSQTYETKTDSLAKQSALTQKVDGLRSEVSETYATKTDFNNASSTTNMWPNQWFDTSKPCIGRAPVGNEIEAAPVGGNIRIIDGRDHYSSSVSSSVMPGRKYKVSVDAKKISGTKSVISGGIWYSVQSSWNSWDGVGDFTNVKNYGNNWYRFERTVTVPEGKTMGTVFLQLGENSDSSNPAKWKISNLRFEDVTDIADIQANYSTKSYVDQTARTVSLGVVEEYKNGQHGSALATQSDISVAKDSITSTVSKTYLSKSDFNNLQISGGRNIARDTKAFGRNNVTDKDTGYLRYYVDRTNGTYNGCTVRSLTSSDATSQTVFEYGVNNIILGEYYTMSFWAKGSGKMRLYCSGPSGYVGAKRIAASDGQAAAGSYNDGSTDMTLSSGWKRYWVVWQLNNNPPGGYSASKYFLLRNNNKMSSCDVCGVMIEKGNKASEWSPAPEDIEKTYATKSEVKQTADGLNVTISGLQSTANNASSNAANAQNRVGNLETCIKMTADGVRVGKINNSNFTGYSALVNSAGSFDILDSGGNKCSSFNQNTIKLGENNNDSVIDMGNGTVKFYGSKGSNALNIDTRDKGPITINGYDLGLIGRSCLLRQTRNVTAQTGRFVNAPLEPAYINTKGQCATRVEPFTQDGDGVRINVKGLYLISLSGVPIHTISTDIVRLSLDSTDGRSYIMCQFSAVEEGNMMSHTEIRILDAKTYHLTYECDQGGGSILTAGFVTITFMGYLE